MANERNAGRKPKYKKGTETVRINPTVPKQVARECIEAIDEIVKPFKVTSLSKPPQSDFVATNIAVKKVQKDNLDSNVKLQEKK